MEPIADVKDRRQLAAAIDDARAELASTITQLRSAVREQFDWREWVRRNPLLAASIAGAVGYRLGRGRWL
jgi:hypothetical protein